MLGLLAATWVDWNSGGQLASALLYIVPVAALALYGPIGWVGLGAALATVLWTSVYLLQHPHQALGVAIWNGFTRFVIFEGVGALVWQYQELRRLAARLQQHVAREEVAARRDPLTGLHNLRSFLELLQAAIDRSATERRRLCLAMLDLDHFKKVNDLYGHEAGNAALRQVAGDLSRICGAGARVARLGGDEFAVLFDHGDLEMARTVAVEFINTVGQLAQAYPGSGLGASVGLVLSSRSSWSPDGLLKAADHAMYQAKEGGRSRCTTIELDGDESQA